MSNETQISGSDTDKALCKHETFDGFSITDETGFKAGEVDLCKNCQHTRVYMHSPIALQTLWAELNRVLVWCANHGIQIQ